MIGKTLSHYRILEHLGGGGMGVVYKAQDLRLDRPVALKFLPHELTADPEARHRFAHEAKAVSALQHNAICTIHDIDETDDGQMFIVMDFYEGETLKKKIERGPMPLEEVLLIGSQIADGLAAAHEAGMVHRDIKPANILVTRRGEVKILDFGIARLAGQTRLTRDGAAPGTLAYMSPEQLRGEEVDRRTDLWSAGVVLYEMLTARLPFRGEFDQALGYSILNEIPVPVTSVRAGLPMESEGVLARALTKDRAERYQHADDMGADLRRLLHESDADRRPAAAPPAAVQAGSRRRNLLIAAGVLGAFAIGVFLFQRLFFASATAGEPLPIAVISFENQTGDQRFDYLSKAIPNLLITSLEQSHGLRVTTWERLKDLARQTGGKGPDQMDRDEAFTLCQAAGVRALVLGSYTRAGEEFATDAKIYDVASKNLLLSARSRGEGQESILRSQIDALSEEILRRLLESRLPAEKERKPISEFTTSSLEAYDYYLLGREKYDNQDVFDALKLLTLATQRDSSFALAYLYLAKVYGNLARITDQAGACRRAFRLASRASEKERMYIEAGYAEVIEQDRPKQIAILEVMKTRFPGEKEVRYRLGLAYFSGAQRDRSVAELEEAIRLDPGYGPALNQLAYICVDLAKYDRARELLSRYRSASPAEPNPYDSWGDLYLSTGDLDSAVIMFREAVKRKPDFFASSMKIALVFALREDYDAAVRGLGEMMVRAPTTGMLAIKGLLLALEGRAREARENSRRAAETWRTTGAVGFTIFGELSEAWVALGMGRLQDAALHVGLAKRSVVLAQSPQVASRMRMMCELPLVDRDIALGHVDSARARLGAMTDSLVTLDTWTRRVMEYELGVSRGEMLLAGGYADSAVAYVHSLALPPNPPLYSPNLGVLNLPVMHPRRYSLAARAYAAKGDTTGAIREAEKLIRVYPQRPDFRLVHPVLHYDLAILLDRAGERGRARAEYEKFVRLWAKADGKPAELQNARRRVQELSTER